MEIEFFVLGMHIDRALLIVFWRMRVEVDFFDHVHPGIGVVHQDHLQIVFSLPPDVEAEFLQEDSFVLLDTLVADNLVVLDEENVPLELVGGVWGEVYA